MLSYKVDQDVRKFLESAREPKDLCHRCANTGFCGWYQDWKKLQEKWRMTEKDAKGSPCSTNMTMHILYKCLFFVAAAAGENQKESN